MNSKNHNAALLLGGNLGDTKSIFKNAHNLLAVSVVVTAASGIYQTEAWGMKEGTPPFLNQVLLVETQLTPLELLHITEEVEAGFGRKRSKNEAGYQSRSLDIDILFYDEVVLKSEFLILPHPRMHLRRFTLVPLREVAPDWQHPVLKKSIHTLLDEADDTLSVTPYE